MTCLVPTIRGIAALAGLLLFSSGCLPRNQSADLLHARLRQNEENLADLQSQLQSSQSYLKQARREIDSLRTQVAESGRSNLTPEQAAALVQVTGIDVQPWLTGGVDKDDSPGDDALVVHFTPRDDQGEPVKLPGQVHITLTDPSAAAGEQMVGEWTFSPEECRNGWLRGWLGGGYQFTLPWQESPASSRLVVHVDFETPDGRSFDDTQLVKVHPSPDALAKRHRPGHHLPPPEIERDEIEGIRQAGRRQTAKKPRSTSEDSEDRPETPHSVNWTEDTIPRLR